MSAQTLRLAFALRGRRGAVTAEVLPNTDPEELGHSLVADEYDEDAFRGFPAVTAWVSYDGRGPRAWMGWLQVIEARDDDGGVATRVDAVPVLGESSPLYTFGYCPTFSDFPANPHHPDGDWVADTFLVAVPDVVRSQVLFPVVGLRWGYRLQGGRPVELFAPSPLPVEGWRRHRSLLETDYPSWTFLESEPELT